MTTHTPAPLAQGGSWLRMEWHPTWETNGKHRSRTASGPEGPQERSEAIAGPVASHRGICTKQGRKLTQLAEFLILRMHVYSCKLSFCP